MLPMLYATARTVKVEGIGAGVSLRAYSSRLPFGNECRLRTIKPESKKTWNSPINPTVGKWMLQLEA